MSLENVALPLSLLSERKLIPIGFAALIVLLAIWLTRLDDRVNYLEHRLAQHLEKRSSDDGGDF